MTYNVSGGTLNLAQSINQIQDATFRAPTAYWRMCGPAANDSCHSPNNASRDCENPVPAVSRAFQVHHHRSSANTDKSRKRSLNSCPSAKEHREEPFPVSP